MNTLRRRALLLALLLGGCSASERQRQVIAANAVAAFANGAARPAILEAARLQCDPDRLCPRPPCEAVLSRTLECYRTWDLVVIAYDRAADAHTEWRLALERCRSDGGAVCSYSIDRAFAAFGAAFGQYRCQVRALGRLDLDPPLPPPDCGDPRDH